MRKIVYLAMGAVCFAGALALSACGKAPQAENSYKIAAEYHAETHTLTAEMTASLKNPLGHETDTFKFQLWPNAFREGAEYAPVSDLFAGSAYYNGASYGGIEVTAVGGAESFSVCGEDENILAVKFATQVGKNARISLNFTFTVQLAEVNHRLGVTESAVNLANFYPVLCHVENGEFCEHLYAPSGDPFVSEIADYDVTLTLPESYTLVSGFAAEQLQTEAQEGKNSYRVRAAGVRDVAFVFGERFEYATQTVGDTEVAYYYTAADPDPERTLKIAADSLAYFSKAFGEYAYPRYTVVMTDFAYGGMEYPALSMISSALHENEMPIVVAHETAHQWWYAMVGSNQYESAWQDEGLAEFSTALFLNEYPEYGVDYSHFVETSEQSYRAFFSVTSQLSGEANTAMNRPLITYSGDYEYRNIAYDKGVILFDRVRDVAGERKCMNALKKYFNAYNGKIATADDLISCFEQSGANVRALFDSFTEGRCVI